MDSTIEAIYENGVLRPVLPLTGIAPGQRVTLRIEAAAAPPTVELTEEEKDVAFRRHLEEIGFLVRWPKPERAPDPNYKPIVIDGPPLSQQIIEDRR